MPTPSQIGNFFSSSEVQKLEGGLPRLEEWSTSMLVPFEAQRVHDAAVLWINTRWFLERGLDTSIGSVHERVSNWLVSDFSYVVPQTEDPTDAFAAEVRTLHADRYGSTTGKSVHGGSGRVATIGCFQAKGIGRTSLAGVGTNWVHSHGCCAIEEGVREAIYAEIAAAEFPHGAVPIIAILDIGLYFPADPRAGVNNRKLRRAVVVRPAVLRLSHAERAPAFLRSLSRHSVSQLADVRRSREVVRLWLSKDSRLHPNCAVSCDLLVLVERIADQVAFGQIHRLFNGGYFSSNLSGTAALLDFGGMRALPNWNCAKTLDRIPGFGNEMKIVLKVVESLLFFFNKYRPPAVPPFSARDLLIHAKEAYGRAFAAECIRLWGITSAAEFTKSAIVSAVRHYFSRQQTTQTNYKHGKLRSSPWIYDAIAAKGSCRSDKLKDEYEMIDAVQRALEEHFAGDPHLSERIALAWASAARLFMPRNALDRELIQNRIQEMTTSDRASELDQVAIDKTIRSIIGQSRRHWENLPSSFLVRGHVTSDGSSALRGFDTLTGDPGLWLEGPYDDKVCYLFGARLDARAASTIGVKYHQRSWTAQISAPTFNLLDAYSLPVGNHSITIPATQVIYPHLGFFQECSLTTRSSTNLFP